eukprot:TRINITY_DN3679_c0_g2_i1.p1 TRINITY_DN3679_c0_g2~~TRINITY_DN3679_c0_g2_i1.p1  ORF type:complete len:1095 (+),score=317.77 TRINITY_DN3679_c0_g2_i1:50-3334(+)
MMMLPVGWILLQLLLILPYGSLSESVLGCGGFIKGGPLDLSRVEVELRSKEGNILKYKTDPAPNNGYYFLPVYEKGDYVLKIKLPPSWETEPSEITVAIDGVSDPCTTNKDLDFVFKGFAISGRIQSKGSEFGPKGVGLQLLDSKGSSLSIVSSGEKGEFSFKSVSPGEYSIQAKSDSFSFTEDTLKVSVQEEAKFSSNIIVSGYRVQGKVLMDENNEPLEGFELKMGEGFRAKTNAKGAFLFEDVPIGSYVIEPLSSKSLQISPPFMKVENVHHEHVSLENPFIIRGFDLEGKVSGIKDPSSLKMRIQRLNKAEELPIKVGPKGDFKLLSVKKGSYSLKPVLDGYDFEELSLEISGPKYQVPEVRPSRFRVSGRVERDRLALGLSGELKVNFVNVEEKVIGKVLVSEQGSFSIYLPPGKVKASVEVSLEDRRKGNGGFSPVEHVVLVEDRPVSELEFTPIKVKVGGSVLTTVSGVATKVLLASRDMEDMVLSADVSANGEFFIDNVLPGMYTASVSGEDGDIRCWEAPTQSLSISEDLRDIKFVQKGFKVDIKASHDVKIYLGKKIEMDLLLGSNTVCIENESFGMEIIPDDSCHRFSVSPNIIQSDTREVNIQAKTHKISGYIRSKSQVPDLNIGLTARGKAGDESRITVELKGTNSHFEFYAESKEEFTVTPKSKEHLFEPERLHLSVENDCMLDSLIFEAREGVFIRGKVHPPLEGVKVSISDEQYGLTDKSGSYQIGPLSDEMNKKGSPLTAYKDGYTFTPSDQKHGDFSAKKLASIEISISDGDAPLSSVLVSISGRESYRNRSVTKGGSVSFLMLEPGEYFVKPILSEYEFEPKNHLFKIEEGDTQTLQIKALRVAFSCYGKISSLNGEAEAGIVVVASGESSSCDNSEAISNAEGDFRIRGLIPGCKYSVGLMQSSESGRIEAFIPKSTSISVEAKDVPQILAFTAVNKFSTTEFSLIVKNDQKFSPIKIKFASLSSDDISIVRKETSDHMILLPTVPLNPQASYLISAETVNEKFNVNKKSASIRISANTTFHGVTLTLNKVNSTPDAVKSNHFWLLSLLLPLGAIALFHKQQPFESLNFNRLRN